MKKQLFISFLFLSITSLFSQKDSLSISPKYWEDQLYISVTYNTFYNQPNTIDPSEVSYGVSFGYIKDIPLNKKNTFALGIGLGYNYDFFKHSLIVDAGNNFSTNEGVSNNNLNLHNLEFPLQLRWRTSDNTTYSFWRIYLGAKLNYNLLNTFSYTLDSQDIEFKNLDNYNKFQTGIELSIGYGTFSFYTYYGITPIFDNVTFDNENVDSKIIKLGLIFYLL